MLSEVTAGKVDTLDMVDMVDWLDVAVVEAALVSSSYLFVVCFPLIFELCRAGVPPTPLLFSFRGLRWHNEDAPPRHDTIAQVTNFRRTRKVSLAPFGAQKRSARTLKFSLWRRNLESSLNTKPPRMTDITEPMRPDWWLFQTSINSSDTSEGSRVSPHSDSCKVD